MTNAPALPIDRLRRSLDGSYTIDRELGRGGMSSVFLAQDRKHAIRAWAESVEAQAIDWPELPNVNEPDDLADLH